MNPYVYHGQVTIIEQPKPKWQVRIGGSDGLCIMSQKAPNRFQRKMQEMVFGFKWEKVDAS